LKSTHDRSAAPNHETGVLLVNLGTPSAPTAPAIRAYLRQFLADPFVVDARRLPWWVVRQLFILPNRPRRLAEAYRSIWTEDGPPLLAITSRLAVALRSALRDRLTTDLPLEIGMRYGEPSIPRGFQTLTNAGCRRVLLLPLYPQFSATTVVSTFDAAADAAHQLTPTPEVRSVGGYASEVGYIEALANSVRERWRCAGGADQLVISFHGLPVRYADLGDPYPEQCRTTAALLATQLGLEKDRWQVSFQSRFGREPWLGPSTEETLTEMGRRRIASLDVISPGFAVDCLETLDELAVQGRELFTAAGGGRFRYLPALNDGPEHAGFLADLATRNLRGWVSRP
jgi:ferrochelatase